MTVEAILSQLAAKGILTPRTLVYFGPLCPGCSRKMTHYQTLATWVSYEGVGLAVYGLCPRCNAEQRISESRAQIVARVAETFLKPLVKKHLAILDSQQPSVQTEEASQTGMAGEE